MLPSNDIDGSLLKNLRKIYDWDSTSYINWNYTYVCNLNCTHCYSRSPRYPKDLSNSQYVNIAGQIVENNVFAVGFGGGEPTLRKDFLEILRILSRGGVDTY